MKNNIKKTLGRCGSKADWNRCTREWLDNASVMRHSKSGLPIRKSKTKAQHLRVAAVHCFAVSKYNLDHLLCYLDSVRAKKKKKNENEHFIAFITQTPLKTDESLEKLLFNNSSINSHRLGHFKGQSHAENESASRHISRFRLLVSSIGKKCTSRSMTSRSQTFWGLE